MNYNYDDEEFYSNREYVSNERFKKTLPIKPTKKLFALKNTTAAKKNEEPNSVEPEVENLKLTWINFKKDEIKTTFYDSDYPSLTFDKNEIIADEKEKGLWTKIEKKNSKNIPDEINYALSMLSSEKFIIFEGTKHYGMMLNKQTKPNQEKTQMCRMNKEHKCRNGNNCRFAHSFSELVINPCNFGEKCKCVKFQKDRYLNFGDRICVYIHPGETKNDYYKRNNLQK